MVVLGGRDECKIVGLGGVILIAFSIGCGGGGGSSTEPPVTNEVTGVSITPGPTTLNAGAKQQFTAKVSGNGSFDATVAWSVNGVPGGNTSIGTITAAGLYVTPFPLPASGSVTITATSTFDLSKSGSSLVTLKVPAVAGRRSPWMRAHQPTLSALLSMG